ncbi:MAG: dTDP-4-dehydrorhamnose reductase [Pseudomonas sp.]
MRILLTGGNGQVGRELLKQLPPGYQVSAPGSCSTDISDPVAVERAVRDLQPELIINAAAYTAVDLAESQSERAWAVNHQGAANVAKAAHDCGAAVFQISTDYVFSGTRTSAYTEAQPTAPLCVYGASKLAGEQVVRETLSKSLVLRTSWVYSAYGNNFVKTMLRLASNRTELSVVEDQIGCPTSAASIASCLWRLAEQYRVKQDLTWGLYHFAGSPGCSWYDFARAIFAQAVESGLIDLAPQVHAIDTSQYPTAAKRPAYSVLDCSLIEKTFDIAQPDWKADLQQLIEALSSMPG